MSKRSFKPRALRRSFVWRFTRRIRQRMTWEYWKTILATIVWAAPLTLLIWGVAEREQIQIERATVRLDPRSDNTTVAIRMPGQATDTADLSFEGPRVGIAAVREALSDLSLAGGVTFYVSNDLPVGAVSSIDLRQALQDEKVFSDNGVQIIAVSPATVDVFVDRIVSQPWSLQVTGLNNPNVIVTFEPATVMVTGPQRVLEASDKQLLVRLPQGSLDGLGTEPRVLQDLPFRYPDDLEVPLSAEPQRVDVTVRRKATVLEQYVIRTMIIRVAKPAATEGEVRVRVEPLVLNNIEVTGPPEQIALLDRGEVQAFAVLDVPANATVGQRSAALRVQLPEGVRLVGEPPTVDYEIIAVTP